MRHGTIIGYKDHRCRCDACRRANRDYQAAWQAGRRLQVVAGVPEFEFGPWKERAECRGRDDLDWFPSPPTLNGKALSADPTYRQAVTAAKAVCAVCPVRADCLTAALATTPTHDHGIRGGTTKAERERLRRHTQQLVLRRTEREERHA